MASSYRRGRKVPERRCEEGVKVVTRFPQENLRKDHTIRKSIARARRLDDDAVRRTRGSLRLRIPLRHSTGVRAAAQASLRRASRGGVVVREAAAFNVRAHLATVRRQHSILRRNTMRRRTAATAGALAAKASRVASDREAVSRRFAGRLEATRRL